MCKLRNLDDLQAEYIRHYDQYKRYNILWHDGVCRGIYLALESKHQEGLITLWVKKYHEDRENEAHKPCPQR